jgi:hypothetical protein
LRVVRASAGSCQERSKSLIAEARAEVALRFLRLEHLREAVR